MMFINGLTSPVYRRTPEIRCAYLVGVCENEIKRPMTDSAEVDRSDVVGV